MYEITYYRGGLCVGKETTQSDWLAEIYARRMRGAIPDIEAKIVPIMPGGRDKAPGFFWQRKLINL